MRRLLPILAAGTALLVGAGCHRGPRRLDSADRTELAGVLKTIPFPVRKADFWARLPFSRREFKPWFQSLTTGTIWDQYYLDDDWFLVLRTTSDGRPDLDDWIDGASITEIPGHPWSPGL